MAVYEIDPLEGSRWAELVETHPSASAFHSRSWLEALRRTYEFIPIVLTTTEPGQPLKNGLVLCRIKSWLTGSRMVSLPFSDHCQPLVDSSAVLVELLNFLKTNPETNHWKYVELRPLTSLDAGVKSAACLAESESFCIHTIDLRPDLEDLFRSFHKNSIRQMIKRAERQGLTIEEGRSDVLLRSFYRLLLLTRRRHQLPPQPLAWFRNLINCFGERLMIRVALKGKQPIASILTLSHKKRVVYKYGCSDSGFHNLGGMPFLFWQAVKGGKAEGAKEFDLGRSELDNSGLIAFKDHWGGSRSQLIYYRYPQENLAENSHGWRMAIAHKAFSVLPDFCLETAGSLLYRHVG
jgi:hypothetical protein